MSDNLGAYDFILRTKTNILALVSILECKSEVSDCEVAASLNNIVIEQLEHIASSCCDFCTEYRLNHD